ncbi:MAG: molybdenum ABC transporter ATP-binding protein [Pseudomonadota bacterium]
MMNLEVNIRSQQGDFLLQADFAAGPGVTALFGHSGAGKTSLLQMIAGLLQPQSGHIRVGERLLFDAGSGINVPAHQRRVGMVFQDARLFPHLTVARNLTYGRWAGKRPGSVDLSRITVMLGIGGLLDRYPSTLSGGERQRVAIGRALLSDPELLLMDEPLASLDQQRRREILPYLEEVRDEIGLPIVYVSHEVDEVARLADTLVLLSDGRVLGSGDAVDMFSQLDFGPALGRHEASALLRGTVTGHDSDYGLSSVKLDGGPQVYVINDRIKVGDRLRMRIKARDVALSLEPPKNFSIRNVLPGTVHDFAQDDSPFVEVAVDVAGQILRARITRHAFDELKIEKGITVHALVKSVAIGQRMLSGRK